MCLKERDKEMRGEVQAAYELKKYSRTVWFFGPEVSSDQKKSGNGQPKN
jgi:hypothetical protein